jgi:signal transduction histidine kinase
MWYNGDMKQRELEPGFLQAYRLFVVTCIVFWVIIGPTLAVLRLAGAPGLAPTLASRPELIERLTLPSIAPVIAVELLLLVLLVLPQARRRLGPWFVPLALALGLIPLLAGYYWWPSDNPLQTPFVIFFFGMLVLIAWQYPFSGVIGYVLGLTVFQAVVSHAARPVPWTVDAGWLVLQGAMMLLVGYVIVALVSVQREQREALARAYEQQTAANAQLQQYADTVEELTISRERNRLARELHDTLAHSLSALTVQLEAVRTLWDVDPRGARAMLDSADEAARRGLREARRALRDLRASPLQDLGLPLAVGELAETTSRRTGAELTLNLPRQLAGNPPPEVEQGIYRIAQEALENIVRHAQASAIVVSLEQEDGALRLEVEDDGLGVGQAGDWAGLEHLGIRGMVERAQLIGGRLEIRDREGKGTRVTLVVPSESETPRTGLGD